MAACPHDRNAKGHFTAAKRVFDIYIRHALPSCRMKVKFCLETVSQNPSPLLRERSDKGKGDGWSQSHPSGERDPEKGACWEADSAD